MPKKNYNYLLNSKTFKIVEQNQNLITKEQLNFNSIFLKNLEIVMRLNNTFQPHCDLHRKFGDLNLPI